MTTTRIAGLVLALTMIATACIGGSDPAATDVPDDATLAFDDETTGAPAEDPTDGQPSAEPDDEAAPDDDGDAAVAPGAETAEPDRPCDGGAFPDDDEFRQALCAVQWAQIDLLSVGGEFDESWGPRNAGAVLRYAEDRAGALAELEALAAEISGAMPDATPEGGDVTADDVEQARADTEDLRTCVVDVGRLIVEANVSAGFDPTAVEAWQAAVASADDLVDEGRLAEATEAYCSLRDQIAAAVDDPSLVPGG